MGESNGSEELNLRQLTLETSEGEVRKFSASELAALAQQQQPTTPILCAIHESASMRRSSAYFRHKESRLLVLYTGGTIGMRPDRRGPHGVYAPEQHYLPKAIGELPPLNDKQYVEEHYGELETKPYSLPPVRGMLKRVVYWLVEYEPLLDSSDMGFDDWIRVASDIKKSYNAYDGFVILHGTDTLAYTACALSFMLENLGKPVVVTGAQIPVSEVRSDGRENMIGALIVAGNLDLPEVMVLFNNKLLRGNRCIKIDNYGLEAFDSPNMQPLATLNISINVNHESVFRSAEVAPFDACESLCRNVAVLRIYPSMPIEAVRAILRPPTEGVVLQTYGSGNLPSHRHDIIHELREAVKRGCIVVNVSQCLRGHVSVSYATSKMVRDAGVILGSDMTTEAALTKLAYVLGKKEWDLHTKRLMMSRNLRGELTVERSERLNELDIMPKLAKFLGVTSGAEAKLLRNALYPPLICYAAHNNDVPFLESLRLSGADVTSADYNHRNALQVAARAGNLEAVEYLLQHGASVHARDLLDENALLGAVHSKNVLVIRAVRQAGGQLTMTPARLGVELCLAAGEGDLSALQAWVEAGANPSTPDYDGRTALHVVCFIGCQQELLVYCFFEAVSHLPKLTANCLKSAGQGILSAVQFLCSNGADPLFCDHFGANPVNECEKAMAKFRSAMNDDVDDIVKNGETVKRTLENLNRIHSLLKEAAFE